MLADQLGPAPQLAQPVPWYTAVGGGSMDPTQVGVFQFPRRGRGRPRGTYKDPQKAADFAAAVAIYGEWAYFGGRPPPPPKTAVTAAKTTVKAKVTAAQTVRAQQSLLRQGLSLAPPNRIAKPYKSIQPYSAKAPDVVVRAPSPGPLFDQKESSVGLAEAAAEAGAAEDNGVPGSNSTIELPRTLSIASSLSGRGNGSSNVPGVGNAGAQPPVVGSSVRLSGIQGFLPGAHLVVVDGDPTGISGMCLAYNAPRDLILLEYIQPTSDLPEAPLRKVVLKGKCVEPFNPLRHENHSLDRRLSLFTPDGEMFDEDDPLIQAFVDTESESAKLLIPQPPSHLNLELLNEREEAIRYLQSDRRLCNCRDIVYGIYLKCSIGLGGCGGWVHPHCCDNLKGKNDKELQHIQAQGYTCSVCTEVTLRKQVSRSHADPNTMSLYQPDATTLDPMQIARNISRRALLARAYLKSDQIKFSNDQGAMYVEGAEGEREYFLDQRSGAGEHEDASVGDSSMDIDSASKQQESNDAGYLMYAMGEGSAPRGQIPNMPGAANQHGVNNELQIQPQSIVLKRKFADSQDDKIADRLLIALGFIPCEGAKLTLYSPSTDRERESMSALLVLGGIGASAGTETASSVSDPPQGQPQVQISSVTDLMPALAVWLTNVAVFAPAIYHQDSVQLVPQSKIQELTDGAEQVRALLGATPRKLDVLVLERTKQVLSVFLGHVKSLTTATRADIDVAIADFMSIVEGSAGMSVERRATLEFQLWSALSAGYDQYFKVGCECPGLVVTLRVMAWCVASYNLLMSPLTSNIESERHAVLRHCKLLMHQSSRIEKYGGRYIVPPARSSTGTAVVGRPRLSVSMLAIREAVIDPSPEYPHYSHLNNCLIKYWLERLVSIPDMAPTDMAQIDVKGEVDMSDQCETASASALMSFMAAEQQALWLPSTSSQTRAINPFKFREKHPYIGKPLSIAPPPRKSSQSLDDTSYYYDIGSKSGRENQELRSLQRAQQSALKSQLRAQKQETKRAQKLLAQLEGSGTGESKGEISFGAKKSMD